MLVLGSGEHRPSAVVVVVGSVVGEQTDVGSLEPGCLCRGRASPQLDDAVDEVGIDEPLADLALGRLLGRQRQLASTNPAVPVGERWCVKCCTQAKLASPGGGVPYAQRGSSASAEENQSSLLNVGWR